MENNRVDKFCLEVSRAGVGSWGGREKGRQGEVTQTVYIHMNKCKSNNKDFILYPKALLFEIVNY
jgi:hypothetical protein